MISNIIMFSYVSLSYMYYTKCTNKTLPSIVQSNGQRHSSSLMPHTGI